MILFDTETTGLIKNELLPLDQQPYIIEVAALKLDDATLEEVGAYTTLVKPPITTLDPVITKITGLTLDDLKSAPTFARILPDLAMFFLGERQMIAHNAPFDRGMLALELRRLDALMKFPWPLVHTCTVETTQHVFGKYMKQEALYKHVTGDDAHQSHRALGDVRQLATIVRWCRKEELL